MRVRPPAPASTAAAVRGAVRGAERRLARGDDPVPPSYGGHALKMSDSLLTLWGQTKDTLMSGEGCLIQRALMGMFMALGGENKPGTLSLSLGLWGCDQARALGLAPSPPHRRPFGPFGTSRTFSLF